MNLKNAYLFAAFGMVSAIALLYGISPSWFAQSFLGISELPVDFAHILRAVMCLYLALGAFWLFCAITDQHKNVAILTTIVFAGGLVIGRVLSLAIDGWPSPILLFYAALEFAIVPVAWWLHGRPD